MVDQNHDNALDPRGETVAKSLGEPLPGTAYRLIERLGAGGMGQVYLGLHVELGREVAIKLLQPKLADDHNAMERLKREARAAAQLGNPHIVDIYDLGVSTDGQPYVVMKLVPGRTLKEIIDDEAPLETTRILRLVRQLTEALKDAHDAGVIHRDLKPENVIVSGEGARERVTILDFGIARRIEDVDKRLTVEGEMIGTAGYMAPEQALAKTIDARADQFALGVMVYEMISGSFPYDGESALRIIAAQLTKDAHPIHDRVDHEVVPPNVCDVVMKALSKDPDGRFEDVIFFANAFAEAIATGKDAQHTMAVSAVRSQEAPKKSPAVLLTGIGVAIAAVVTVLLVAGGPKEGPTSPVENATPVVVAKSTTEPEAKPSSPNPATKTDEKKASATPQDEKETAESSTTAAVPKKPAQAQEPKAKTPKAKSTTARKPTLEVRKKKQPKPTAVAPKKAPVVTPKKVPVVTPEPTTPAVVAAAPITAKPTPAPVETKPAPVTPVAPPPKPAPPPPPSSPPKLVFDAAKVTGGASKRKIRKVVGRAHKKIRACVEGLPSLKAGQRASVKFSIDADGFFGDWSTTGNGQLGQCAQKTLRRVNRLARRPDTGGIWVVLTLRMEAT